MDGKVHGSSGVFGSSCRPPTSEFLWHFEKELLCVFQVALKILEKRRGRLPETSELPNILKYHEISN